MEKTALESFDSLEKRGKQDVNSVAAKEHSNLQAFQKEMLSELTTLKALLLKESSAQPVAQVIPDDSHKDKKIAEL